MPVCDEGYKLCDEGAKAPSERLSVYGTVFNSKNAEIMTRRNLRG